MADTKSVEAMSKGICSAHFLYSQLFLHGNHNCLFLLGKCYKWTKNYSNENEHHTWAAIKQHAKCKIENENAHN